jgi:hypothetical protein
LRCSPERPAVSMPLNKFNPQEHHRTNLEIKTLLLHQMNGGWNTSTETPVVLDGIFDGLTDETADWQHPSYAREPQEKHWPLPGTIRWHVVHLIMCKHEYRDALMPRKTGATAPEAIPNGPLCKLTRELLQAHRELLDAVQELSGENLQKTVGGMQMLDFLTMTIRHDTWHAAQVKLILRLWQHRLTE